jgi:CRISPR/Cas system-associated protein Cas5 (RAMP superfamily)
MLTETFYVCLITTVAGLILKLASLAYKSKCKQCSCFGMSIVRDVALEELYDEQVLNKSELVKTDSEKL